MGGEAVAAGGDVEQRLLSLCAQALSLDSVCLADNFFELGGDSLSAMWLLSGVQDEFKVELPLPLLFDAQTMKDILAVLNQQLALGPAPATS